MYENCMTSIFSIHLMSNYQTLIMACINTTYKRNRNSQRFWKKKFKWKEKKANIIVSRTTSCTRKIKFFMPKKKLFRKMFACVQNSICGWKRKYGANFQSLRTKFDLWLKKNLGQIFKIYLKYFFVSPSKIASHTVSIYKNCMESVFFQKIF